MSVAPWRKRQTHVSLRDAPLPPLTAFTNLPFLKKQGCLVAKYKGSDGQRPGLQSWALGFPGPRKVSRVTSPLFPHEQSC